MNPAEYAALDYDADFRRDLGDGLWLMDNHKWAFYIWHRTKAVTGVDKFSLVHADFHWDAVNQFHGEPAETQRLLEADDGVLLDLVTTGDLIGFDSFIAPAFLRGLLGDVHFYCKQDDGDAGLDQCLLDETGGSQVFHTDLNVLANYAFPNPLIFDLCLDLFNNSDMWEEGELWPQEEIVAFVQTMRPLISAARVVTVSLSFGYSGSTEDTRDLARLVIPMLEQYRTP